MLDTLLLVGVAATAAAVASFALRKMRIERRRLLALIVSVAALAYYVGWTLLVDDEGTLTIVSDKGEHSAFEDWPAPFDESDLKRSVHPPGIWPPVAEGWLGFALDPDSCDPRAMVVLETEHTVTGARVRWGTYGPGGTPEMSEPTDPESELLTEAMGWVEEPLPSSGKVRLSYAWPPDLEWPHGEKLRVAFEVDYHDGQEELTWILAKSYVLYCGDAPLPSETDGCLCPSDPGWAETAPQLTLPIDDWVYTASMGAPQPSIRTLSWEPVSGTPDWEHAYLVEIRLDKSHLVDGPEWCFSKHYALGEYSWDDEPQDPQLWQPDCYLVRHVDEPEVKVPLYYGHSYLWSVRAQCCYDGKLRYTKASEERRVTMEWEIEVGECPPCEGGVLPGVASTLPTTIVGQDEPLHWGFPTEHYLDVWYELSVRIGTSATAPCTLGGPGCHKFQAPPKTPEGEDYPLVYDHDLEPGEYSWWVRAYCPDVPSCRSEWSDKGILWVTSAESDD